MQVWEKKQPFMDLLLEDKEIAEYLAADEITAMFDMEYHTKHIDTIFDRVFP
jgi:adenylosuccinate lyase